jgi:hypothetical protein
MCASIMRSFFIGDIRPFLFDFTIASKFGGNASSGRTYVCTRHGKDSGGVGSSRLTGRLI